MVVEMGRASLTGGCSCSVSSYLLARKVVPPVWSIGGRWPSFHGSDRKGLSFRSGKMFTFWCPRSGARKAASGLKKTPSEGRATRFVPGAAADFAPWTFVTATETDENWSIIWDPILKTLGHREPAQSFITAARLLHIRWRFPDSGPEMETFSTPVTADDLVCSPRITPYSNTP